MNKPLGYWGLSYDNPLIKDIAEEWGQGLERLRPIDKYWLIARLAAEAHLQASDWTCPTNEAQEVDERLDEELPFPLMLPMARALFDCDQPLGYWGFDRINSTQLVKDMVETWGENLAGCPDGDACWLISRIAQLGWEHIATGLNESESDEADEVVSRQMQLKFDEKISLIQALLMMD
ncbi:MAG: hypothetical protein C6Y22_08285 [Hapalosiphonaceae cyanobacterium JJU2]|nr:MAG: hypothetical protein C6Y22_08285 [Hapalosiphonaceae cyanobacterium JJU2]